MKKNFPVTGIENDYNEGLEIISTTSPAGVITSVNEDFTRIAGFSEDELLNKSHNIVRHPDMPQAAFADMWSHLKAGRHWMGIVKNRCKNGDHYWVDAYVTPTEEHGKITGYESVRVKPAKTLVKRAEYLYQQINAGKAAKLSGFNPGIKQQIFVGTSLLNCMALGLPLITEINQLLVLVVGLPLFILATWLLANQVTKPLTAAAADSRSIVDNPLMSLVYTGRADEIGQLQLSNKILQARLRTVLGRVRHSAANVSDIADHTADSLQTACDSMQSQCAETESLSAAMCQLTVSIKNIESNASQAAQTAASAHQESKGGASSATETILAIKSFSEAVQAVGVLQNDAKNIESMLKVIRDIADQTNLLALNASIEAARAGEQGRGFAVVADEVRGLAERTQKSTSEIKAVVESLQAGVSNAINIIRHSSDRAENSMGQVQNTVAAFENITLKISEINQMNEQIATSVTEQSAAVNGINQSLLSIREKAEAATLETQTVSESARSLADLVHALQGLTRRFRA